MHHQQQWLQWFEELSTKDYCVIDDFLSADVFQEVNGYFRQKLDEDELSAAGIGTLQDYRIKRSVRGDKIFWLDEKGERQPRSLFDLLTETKEMLNRYCFLSLSSYEFHLAHYPQGAHYEKHLDQFKERNNRMISMVIYLNENWKPGDGGELRLFLPDGEKDVEPIAKRCILFRSDTIEHEVLVTNADRYSVTGWFLYLPVGLGFFS